MVATTTAQQRTTAPEVDLYSHLLEALILEPKYQPTLALPYTTKDCNEISMRMRNGAAHVLRCLKVWYDLPPDTFFNAINIMDRFLARMKAQPKHLSCIAVSAFSLSCQFTPGYKELAGIKQKVPDRRDITMISQSKCSSADVCRMEGIILDKLEVDLRCQPPVTPLTLLRLLYSCHDYLAAKHLSAGSVNPVPSIKPLIPKLEVIVCDAAATMFRPSELAAALLHQEVFSGEGVDSQLIHQSVFNTLFEILKIDHKSFQKCCKEVAQLIDQYENQRHSPHRQRLVWKLSSRTLKQLRPTDKFTIRLPTIDEKQPACHPFFRPHSEDKGEDEEMDYDYDEEFPPLPTRSSLKSPSHSPRKKHPARFPYPHISRKCGRIV